MYKELISSFCTYSNPKISNATNSCKSCGESFHSEARFITHKSKCYSTSSNLSSFHIDQLDGNISMSSDESFTSSSKNLSVHDGSFCPDVDIIPVIIGNRPLPPPLETQTSLRRTRVLKTLRRSKKAIQGLSLPTITNYNMRSLLPKLDCWVEDFEERSVGLSFLTEIWEKAANKKHQNKLREVFEMKGILYISTPRPGLKRGGGVAIAADPTRFSLSKLNVPNPHNLEVSWGLLKPKKVTGSISKIICCAFYSPPTVQEEDQAH